ncbi:hypothetical protein DM806_20040 [Sphingobium lactosutens]|uniref:nuclear transport factor 2 family protein n=1 Tax=Sphingobium lactosutens TaxID=522773 RepID=UPI0015B84712|nr:nuclear transport factor 2 family protein [Sphingobium lactosutens]NWK97906.1 hypothetical protein [Sphingobium lactosutens]
MSADVEGHKQRVRDFLRFLGHGDVDGLAQILSPDVQATATGTSFMSGTRGYDEILSTAGTLGAITQNGIDFQIVSLTAEEDRVSAEVRGESTLTNGTPYNNEYHFLFTIRGDRIVKISEYFCTKLVEEAFAPLMLQK